MSLTNGTALEKMISKDEFPSRRKRILFVTQWFEPEPAFKGIEFAKALAASGYDVQVLTGFPNYPIGKIYPGYRIRWRTREVIDGISTDRVLLWPSHGRSSIGRAANYLSFFIRVLIYCLAATPRYDLTYVYHPPITPGLAVALASKIRCMPFVLDVQDLWPDSVAASGMANSTIVAVLRSLCSFVYRTATTVVVQSQGMLEALAERGIPEAKLERIYNWSNYSRAGSDLRNENLIPADVCASFRGNFNIVYGGNLGQAQALECLIAGALRANQINRRIKLHLFGDGIEKEELRKLANEFPDVIELHDAQARKTMDRIFEQSDALALHLKDVPLYRRTIPSKLQHYLSIGRPIVAGIAGEGASLLKWSGCAFVSPPMDTEGLCEAMVAAASLNSAERAAMRQSGARYYEQHFSFQAAMAKTNEIIDHSMRAFERA